MSLATSNGCVSINYQCKKFHRPASERRFIRHKPLPKGHGPQGVA
jgi:hypothetical protein